MLLDGLVTLLYMLYALLCWYCPVVRVPIVEIHVILMTKQWSPHQETLNAPVPNLFMNGLLPYTQYRSDRWESPYSLFHWLHQHFSGLSANCSTDPVTQYWFASGTTAYEPLALFSTDVNIATILVEFYRFKLV